MSPGQRLRTAIDAEQPLQMVGVINAYCALLAEQSGFQAIYLSGAGLANARLALPDLGVVGLRDVVDDAAKITRATSVPLLVDADTGWGSALAIERGVQELTQAGVAGMHLEDQVDTKRCGHRPGKMLVPTETMVERVSAAVAARTDASFLVMARTDAYSVEGLPQAITRARAYVAAGADAIFAEAMTDLAEYTEFAAAVQVPVLANLTEFGRTPLFTREEIAPTGVRILLYPLSAFRAMNQAALDVYQDIRQHGTQQASLSRMQTRDELYRRLDYTCQEQRLDDNFGTEPCDPKE